MRKFESICSSQSLWRFPPEERLCNLWRFLRGILAGMRPRTVSGCPRGGKVSPEFLRYLPITRRTLPFSRELGRRLASISLSGRASLPESKGALKAVSRSRDIQAQLHKTLASSTRLSTDELLIPVSDDRIEERDAPGRGPRDRRVIVEQIELLVGTDKFAAIRSQYPVQCVREVCAM